ncbi:MAG: XRE family transcriptional regulator, partial [Gammaproteobacteria bacterium]
LLHNSRARDLAKLGDVQDALRAVGAADEAFSHAHPAEDPPWMASYTEARHTGFAGSVLFELGINGRYIAETRHRLATSVAARPDGRGRTGHQLKHARLVMATGDPLEAAALGTQALDWSATLRSSRIVHGLRDLRHLAEPHANRTEVADLRDRIRTLVAA